MALDNFRFLTIPETSHTSKTIVWFSQTFHQIICVENNSLYLSVWHEIQLFFYPFSYPLEPLVFLDNDLLSFRYFEHSFPQWFWCINLFTAYGGCIRASLQLALVLIPKSIHTELSVLGNTSGKTSTTKLRKYLLAESLITVTDDGIAGSSLEHRILSFPIFPK